MEVPRININERLTFEVQKLLNIFEDSQWNHIVDYELLKKYDITTRETLRNIKMEKFFFTSKTSFNMILQFNQTKYKIKFRDILYIIKSPPYFCFVKS